MFDGSRFTVSEITELIRACLEGAFPALCVEGEISNYRPSSTGHLYFTLKDSGASLQAVMFKNRLRSLAFTPKDGMLVRAHGSLSVYAQRGSYQIVCESLEQAGIGDLLALLEERKRRLAAEGLFDAERKRSLPRFPERVALVSSPTGAALRDILNILRRRAPGLDVVVLPCAVQGAEAASAIVRRIEQANAWNLADVLIVGRGGGSLEDLLPFSEESVVRAVAASRLPIISAVGHEIDWALSDFAADLRAPTPSAAAELVSADRQETAQRVDELSRVLRQTIDARVERVRLSIKPFDPSDLEYRFRALLQPRLVRLDDAKENLLTALGERAGAASGRVDLARRELEAANPEEVLARGFSVVYDARGKVLRDAAAAQPGSLLKIRPLRGQVTARVESSGGREET